MAGRAAGAERGGACELLIRGARVVDGTGGPAFRADVAVADGVVAAVGSLAHWEAERTLAAGERVLAPGFIDVHTHDDRALLSEPAMAAKVSQGVTTVVVGNCGVSLAPFPGGDAPGGLEPVPPLNLLGGRERFRYPTFGAYVEALRRHPAAVNVAPLVGHTTLRAQVLPRLDRAATGAEAEAMARLLDEALGAGAMGLSTGLAYPPARAASTEEVVTLARRVGAAGGLYATHLRDEKAAIMEAVEEALQIGREGGLPVVLSHHKVSGRENWGRSVETLAAIARAREGQRVDLDVYPYTASSTVLLPEFVASAERVMITWSEPVPEASGRCLDELEAEWGVGTAEAVERLQPAGAIYFQMDEEDLRRILAFPGAMVGSDGLPHDRHPHPRLWGTFPRVLGRYVRELGLLSLEEGVHRMSGRPAEVFGLRDRGRIAPGMAADLVLFDPDRILDRATFSEPCLPASGVERVFVNGVEVWVAEGGDAGQGQGPGPGGAPGGVATGRRPGRVLRRQP